MKCSTSSEVPVIRCTVYRHGDKAWPDQWVHVISDCVVVIDRMTNGQCIDHCANAHPYCPVVWKGVIQRSACKRVEVGVGCYAGMSLYICPTICYSLHDRGGCFYLHLLKLHQLYVLTKINCEEYWYCHNIDKWTYVSQYLSCIQDYWINSKRSSGIYQQLLIHDQLFIVKYIILHKAIYYEYHINNLMNCTYNSAIICTVSSILDVKGMLCYSEWKTETRV